MKLQPGAVLGHEIGGIIEAVGSNVRAVRLLSLVASKKLKPTALVSRTVSLGDVESVLHDMDSFKTSGYVVITDFD